MAIPSLWMSWISTVKDVVQRVAGSPIGSMEPDTVVINTQPSSTALSGVPLLIQPIIGVLNSLGVPDILYVGPMTVTLVGTGTLTGTTTTLAVAGIALFVGLTITGSGNFQLLFTLPNGQTVLSGTISVV
jgi:hypothetical protein